MKISWRTILVLSIALLTVGSATIQFDWLGKLLVLFLVLGPLTYLLLKLDSVQERIGELSRLRSAYEQLDQQAKLIIRTDLELHQAQEQLDRQLSALFALHALSQQLRVNLQPDAIYSHVNVALVRSFGFTKGLVGLCPSPQDLRWQVVIGLNEQDTTAIHQHLLATPILKDLFEQPAPRTLTALTCAEYPAGKHLLELLSANTVVVAGIKPQSGPSGCVVLGRDGAGMGEERGDEELVSLLATHLAIAVENSSLYEELWHSRHELEQKVQARTRELADMNEQLVRLNKAKSNFVSAVSHELRTPLAAIKGYAALLRGGQFGPLVDPQTERLTRIEKQVDLLTQLINNLLDIARIESGRVTMEQRPIQTEELLNTVIEMVKPQLDAKHIQLTTQLDGVTQLLGDATHLPRVFMNLLSNALKYTPEHGSIIVQLRRESSYAVATIQDSGCGIAPEELPKLFQEFYRSSNPINERVRGTGLGLVLVKRIIEAHHGNISVASEPGKGTTFTFTLPLEPSAPIASPTTS